MEEEEFIEQTKRKTMSEKKEAFKETMRIIAMIVLSTLVLIALIFYIKNNY